MPPPGAWRQFQTWAKAGVHPALPATPEAVALYLGHLAAGGRSLSSVELARAAISLYHAGAGMQKSDTLRHLVLAKAMPSDALFRIRDLLRLPRGGRGGRMESPETAHKRAALDLANIGGLGYGFTGHSGRIGMARRTVAVGARGYGRSLHPGRGRRRSTEVARLVMGNPGVKQCR